MTTRRITTPRTVRLTGALSAVAAALALADCGSTADPQSGAGSPSSSAAGSGSSSRAQSDARFTKARDAYDLKLARCLRAAGADVKDPQPGKGITETGPEIQAAYPGCARKIGDPPTYKPSAAQKAEDLKAQRAQARCLRGRGYDIPDPTPDSPGFVPGEVSEADFETCRIR
jgi:hypothetical protein